MALVKDIVTHILFHVDSEASTSDASQASGVAQRARLVRDTLQSLKDDGRDLTLQDSLLAMRDLVPTNARKASFLQALDNIKVRPQLAIQTWVSKNR